MFVSQICKRKVVSVMRQATVVEAAQLMREHHVGDVVVLESHAGQPRPAGILTDRDIAISGVAQAHERIADLLVEDLMTPSPITIWENDTLEVAIETMRRHGVRRLPVINQQEALVGVLSSRDVLERLTQNLSHLVAYSRLQHAVEEDRRA